MKREELPDQVNRPAVHCSPKAESNVPIPKQPHTNHCGSGLSKRCTVHGKRLLTTPNFLSSMDSICQKFLQAERDFLLAARSDSQLLVDFAERWQTLHSEWESHSKQADHSTQELVNGIVANVEELAGDIYVVESYSLSLEDDLLNGLEDALALLTLDDPVVVRADPAADKRIETCEPSSPNFTISPAEWLLRNLHNPYPLPHVQFSTHRNASLKHARDWFAKARQRIGWARLLRDRFGGCRSLAIDAAFRAFIRDDPISPLDPDLKTAFLAIKSHAELVYGDEGNDSHPSPKRPRSISPAPSLTFSSTSEDTDDEQCSAPPSTTNFNRSLKRVSPDPSDSPSPKRRRFVTHCLYNHHTSLIGPRVQPPPSPASWVRGTPSPCVETAPLRPRKRRLSESSHDGPLPNRPRGTEGGRNYAVSDPLQETVPKWFDFGGSFQFPNPASTGPLELSSFDVDFFNPLPLPSFVIPSTTGESRTSSMRTVHTDTEFSSAPLWGCCSCVCG